MAEDQDDDLYGGATSTETGDYSSEEEEVIPIGEVDFLHDVPMHMQAQIGKIHKTMKEILSLKPGAVLEFNKVVGEPMDVLIGGRLMCRGEIVVVNERYGIRVSEVVRAEDKKESNN
jgi:flagellar motor switch protein FliN